MISENGKPIWYKTEDGMLCWTGGSVKGNGKCTYCGSSRDHYEVRDEDIQEGMSREPHGN